MFISPFCLSVHPDPLLFTVAGPSVGKIKFFSKHFNYKKLCITFWGGVTKQLQKHHKTKLFLSSGGVVDGPKQLVINNKLVICNKNFNFVIFLTCLILYFVLLKKKCNNLPLFFRLSPTTRSRSLKCKKYLPKMSVFFS